VNSLARKIALFLADGQTDHFCAKGPGGEFGKAAPAAADLEDVSAGRQRKLGEDPPVLRILRRRRCDLGRGLARTQPNIARRSQKTSWPVQPLVSETQSNLGWRR
jgi:hypothetical protein